MSLLRVLAGEATAVPPIWLMRQAGRYLPEYREVRGQAESFLDLCYRPDLAVEVTLQPVRRFGFDAAILFSDILVIPDALGQSVTFRDGDGPRLDPVRSAADFSVLDVSRLTVHLAPVYEAVGRIRAQLSEEVALIGFAGAPWTVATYMVEGAGSRDFLETKRWAYADTSGFAALIDLLCEATARHLVAQIDAGVEVVQLFDTWAGVLPACAFRSLVIEPTRRIVEQVKAAHPAVPIIGFPRGAGPLYVDYLAETGVTAVSLDTAMPLDWAKTHLQSLGPVQGNLDPIALVVGGTALGDGVARIKRKLAGAPYVFNLGHGILPQTPLAHVGELVRLVRGSGA